MSWLNLGNDEKRKYKVGDIVEDKWGRKGKIIALRGCSCCGQLYEVENIKGYIVEGNLKGKVIEERLNKWLKLNQENNELIEIIKKYNEDYKSRIDKAIKYCDLNMEFTPRLIDVKNILNGDDE